MDDQPDHLLLMIGEMRADLKYLVAERKRSSDRLDAVEVAMTAKAVEQDVRIGKLEHFRTRIGVVTTALGILVPTAITAAFHKLGLL